MNAAPNIAFDFVALFVAGVLFITCVIIAVEMFCEDTATEFLSLAAAFQFTSHLLIVCWERIRLRYHEITLSKLEQKRERAYDRLFRKVSRWQSQFKSER
jgi:hypothetical protein